MRLTQGDVSARGYLKDPRLNLQFRPEQHRCPRQRGRITECFACDLNVQG